jgi:hypothetical protein
VAGDRRGSVGERGIARRSERHVPRELGGGLEDARHDAAFLVGGHQRG